MSCKESSLGRAHCSDSVDGAGESGSDCQRGGGTERNEEQNRRYRGFVMGADFSDRAKGYAQGMVVRFVDRAALAAFYPHPEHRRVLQNFVSPISADILVVDYEF